VDYLRAPQRELKKQISMIQDLIDYQLHENESWIRETIRSRWALGLKPDGSIIGLYAGEDYAREKFSKNSSAGFGNVDLTLTGSLWKGIQISGFKNEYEVFSKDSKYDEIVDKYGEYNFNISEDEKKILFDRIMANILTEVIRKTYALL
jgi:hypothetical protein